MSVRSAFPTLGILGGGQLGRMMAVAAIPMGLHIRFLAPTPAGPMEGLGEQIVGDWKDPDVLRRFAKGCDVVTAESEWAPAEHVEALGMPHLAVRPTGETLRLIRDKGLQKQTLADAGLPAPDFRRCPTLADAHDAARAFGYPVLLKKYRGSYDGYGNATVRADAELDAAWAELADETGALVEAFVPFARELSVLVARRADTSSTPSPTRSSGTTAATPSSSRPASRRRWRRERGRWGWRPSRP